MNEISYFTLDFVFLNDLYYTLTFSERERERERAVLIY